MVADGECEVMASILQETFGTSKTKPNYCVAETLCGTTVFVELTTAQTLLAGDAWQDDRVLATEERGGEVILHDVRLGDLTNLRAEVTR